MPSFGIILKAKRGVLPEDVEYATKFCVMRRVGQVVGSTMPEIYEEDDGDGDGEVEEVPEEDCPEFVRYSGDDPLLNEVNLAYDMWDTWVPQSPAEEMLKNAVNSNEHLGA